MIFKWLIVDRFMFMRDLITCFDILIQNIIFKASQKLILSSIIRSVSKSVSHSVCPKLVFQCQRSLRRNNSPLQSMQSQRIKVKVPWKQLPTQSPDDSCIIQFQYRVINSIILQCDLPRAWTIFHLYIEIRWEVNIFLLISIL